MEMDYNDTPPQLETTYEWEIENFSMCPHSIGECLRSNTFYLNSIDVSEYQLVLYPRGRLLDETPLCLLECQKESDFRINVTMAIALEGEQMEIKKEKFLMNTREPISVKFERFKKPLEKLQFSLLPGELFVVRCTITLVYDPQTDVQDLVTLSEDLERLYRSGLFSDFCLTASDGRRFHVHKIMLTTRCPELAKKVGIFDRGDCKGGLIRATSEALEVFLEYVYTGRLRGNVASEVLVETHSVAVEYDIDDLKREIFPLEICTVGRTIIKVDHHYVTWNFEDFRTKVEENDWPARTFIDLVVGHIVASFSVVTSDNSTTTQIDLMCLRSNLSTPITMKCVVQVILPLDESIAILCKGEHKFYPDDPRDVFRLRGDLAFHLRYKPVREYPDTLVLMFDFRLSYPRNDSDRCNNVEGINSLDSPHPFWKRSLHRLSADLDTAYKDTYEGSDSDWRTHSDLRVGVGFGPAIPVHRCILSARSDSLMSLINKNLLSALDNTCEIHMLFLDLRTVHHVMRYVYSGKFPQDVDVKELIPVYMTSARYEMEPLAEKCLQLIRRKVELKHLKHLLALSDNWQLRTVAVNFASKIRDRIEHTPEWAEIVRELPHRASRFLLDVISAPDAPDSTSG